MIRSPVVWVALRSAVFWSWLGSGLVYLGTGVFLRPQGVIPPGFYPPYGGLGLLPGVWDAPIKGNADGAEGIFSNAGRVWAAALRLDPPLKGLVPYSLVRWGVTNTQPQYPPKLSSQDVSTTPIFLIFFFPISTFIGYLMKKPSLWKNSSDTI